jgi:hypothetical protein
MSAYHQLQDVKTVIQGLMMTLEDIPQEKTAEEELIDEIYQLLEKANARLEPYRDMS